MFLKKIEAQGFKSFADKTVLEFGQGATAIVGPNGSGKSNISDAIRWVMGEMSAKSLRGASMQDIIFAGTQTRKAVNFAEVSLVLDNTDKTFDIEFEEVTVTRRVFRSGESAYFINKAPCRLKDIHELFMDTGLGRDGYSIIGQGNVAQILSTKAEDRRSIFEEAAGVSKYKHRKEESERKLETVNENLVRINDIISELENQLKPLGDQSEKARKYLALYEEFKKLDISVSVNNIEKNQTAVKETETQYKNVCGELDDLHEKEGEFEQTLSGLYEESKQKDSTTEQMHEKLRENELKQNECQKDITIAENNIENNKSMIERFDRKIVELKAKNEICETQIGELSESIKQHNDEIDGINSEFEELRKSGGNIDKTLDDYRAKIDDMKADTVQLMNEVSSDKSSINGIDNLRQSFLERKSAVETELQSHNDGLTNTKSDIEKTNSDIAETKQKLTQMQERAERVNGNIANTSGRIEKYTQELNRLNVEYNSKSSKKRMLVDMENSYEGFARSVKMVLKADELKNIAMYGTVSGLINVDKKFVTAIEIALGGAMQNIVVETEQDAKTAIEYLKRARGGRATFLPISSVNGRVTVPDLRNSKGYIGVASELVQCDRKYQGIIMNLLGRVAVVDNIDNAIAISRQYGYKFRIVTLEGDVLNSGGSMSGGSTNQSGGFLSRANDIKVLTGELSDLAEKIKQYTAEREQLQNDLNSMRNQSALYMPMVREYEDKLLRLENTAVHLTQNIENSSKQKENLTKELEQINEQLAESNDEVGKYINAIAEKENNINKLNAQIEELQREYEDAAVKKDEYSKLAMDTTLKLNTIQKDIQVANDKIAGLQRDIQVNNNDISEKNNDKEVLEKQNNELIADIELKKKNNIDLGNDGQKIKSEIEDLGRQKENIVRRLQEIQNSNKDLTEKLLVLQEERTRIENKKEKLLSEYNGIVNHLWDEYELAYNEAAKRAEKIGNEKETEKKAAELKMQMKSLGNVNVESIDEYNNVKERYEFLSKQKNDLDESKEDLNKVIQSMQKRMEEDFAKQFKAINESFNKVFAELFGGGSGRLHLSDESNILESGIEIEVQLPGKSPQNINLYSGGEKSFIAIALLFAILDVKPTPFCILDEIDAALDDVNVSRFATYLKNYISATQFIVITHRRGTMEAANVLYGVTMQEKGVSKLLSLHIDDVAEDMVN